jgi:flagellar protein FlgJ
MDVGNHSVNQISDASLYTDFSGLQKLRSKVSNHGNTAESIAESRAANKEVAKQFESLFLQMMLKSMRDATITGDSAESDQTRFYQEMFDKQIALDLASNKTGGGLGIAEMLERDMGVVQESAAQENNGDVNGNASAINNIELIRNQINRSSSVILQSDLNSTVDEQE